MGDFRYLAVGLGFTLIIVFGFVTFFSSGVSEYDTASAGNFDNLELYTEFNEQVSSSTGSVGGDLDVNIDAGQIILGGAISFLKGIFTGQWLGLFSNLFTESFSMAGIPGVQIALFIGVVFLIIIMIVISSFIGRDI